MATIHSLNLSISQMTDDQALSLVRTIRKNRHIIPEKRKAVVAKTRETKAKSSQRTVDLLSAMSREDRLALIKMLEEQA